jgi:hypothetical protein
MIIYDGDEYINLGIDDYVGNDTNIDNDNFHDNLYCCLRIYYDSMSYISNIVTGLYNKIKIE